MSLTVCSREEQRVLVPAAVWFLRCSRLVCQTSVRQQCQTSASAAPSHASKHETRKDTGFFCRSFLRNASPMISSFNTWALAIAACWMSHAMTVPPPVAAAARARKRESLPFPHVASTAVSPASSTDAHMGCAKSPCLRRKIVNSLFTITH